MFVVESKELKFRFSREQRKSFYGVTCTCLRHIGCNRYGDGVVRILQEFDKVLCILSGSWNIISTLPDDYIFPAIFRKLTIISPNCLYIAISLPVTYTVTTPWPFITTLAIYGRIPWCRSNRVDQCLHSACWTGSFWRHKWIPSKSWTRDSPHLGAENYVNKFT